MDLAIAKAVVDSFAEDLRNSGAKEKGAAGARPVGGAWVPLPAASKAALGHGCHTAGSSAASSSTSTREALGQGSHTAGRSAASSSTSAQASQAAGRSAAGSSTSAHASQAVSTRGSHLATGSSRSCHLAADSQAVGGRGPPIQVTYKSTTRSLHDGGGLCSPGRWPPGRRRLPDASCDATRAAFTGGLRAWQKRLKETPGGEGRAFAELASGKLKSAPCKVEAIGVGLAIDRILHDKGFEPDRLEGVRSTLINYRRMSATLKMMGDPDCDFLAVIAAEGVPIGVDVELPRTPTVFEEKTKWPLEPEEAETAEHWGDGNYESAVLHLDDIRRQIVEDVAAGAAVRMTVAAAKKKYGDRLTISGLGAVLMEPGSEVVRVLYDGTNGVHSNNRIRGRDRARCPMIEDLEALLREVEDAGDGEMHFVIVYDIAKAHRLVPVREEDWGLQAFQLTGKPEDSDEVIMYSGGTFGIASAAYWWARVSAAMVRLLHFCLGLLWGRCGTSSTLRTGLR